MEPLTTLGPFISDDTGGTHTQYTPTEVGAYTFQMSFPGQTLAGANLYSRQAATLIIYLLAIIMRLLLAT